MNQFLNLHNIRNGKVFLSFLRTLPLAFVIQLPSPLLGQEIFSPILIFGHSTEDFTSSDPNLSLKTIHQSIVKTIRPSAVSFSEISNSITPLDTSLNQRNYIRESFWIDRSIQSEAKDISYPIHHQWISCRGMGKTTLILESSSLDLQEILAISHVVIPDAIPERKKAPHQPAVSKLLLRHQDTLADLYTRNIEQIKFNPITSKKSPIKLDSQFAKGEGRLDEINEKCLQLLVIEPMLTKYRFLSFVSREEKEVLMNFVNTMDDASRLAADPTINTKLKTITPKQTPIRSNTRLLVHWADKDQKGLKLNIGISESVFGQSIVKSKSLRYTFTLSENKDAENSKATWILESTPDLETILQLREESLDPKNNPRIARIHKAWVYLDKGRAWGLRINDRLLLSTDNNATIANPKSNSEGHVVGFFGPELNIQDSKGQRIHEGAIVYIRKGQKNVNLGDLVILDPKTFPASR